MADQRKYRSVTVPAGTPQATPASFDISFAPARVERIDWRVPPGSLGALGWILEMGGVQVLPELPDPYVVATSETGYWDGGGLPDSGAWGVSAYNLGSFAHTLYLVFHLAAPSTPPMPRVLWTPADLSLAPDARLVRPSFTPRGFPLAGPR